MNKLITYWEDLRKAVIDGMRSNGDEPEEEKKEEKKEPPIINQELNDQFWNTPVSSDSIDEGKIDETAAWLKVNGVKIIIKQGDLVAEKVDAITNAANELLYLTGGVSGAIRKAAGEELSTGAKAWIDKNGNVPTGGSAFTVAGKLSCNYVIHSVGPVYHKSQK